MLPVLNELLVGLVANGLYDLIRRAAEPESAQQKDAATLAVHQALDSLHPLPQDLAEIDENSLEDFLSTPEAQFIVRQIYAADRGGLTEESLRQEFCQIWMVRSSAKDTSSTNAVNALFDYLVELTDQALERAIASGSISAHDAKAARQHRHVRDSLQGIERALEVLGGSKDLDPADIEEFVNSYRRQVAKREGVIVPPALDAARDFPIDALYVPPRFTPPWQGEDDISYTGFASGLYRSVVLGNPGSGKSTLAKKLTTDIATDAITLPTVQAGTVPFLVILRDYGAKKKEGPCSVLDFIRSTVNARYQLEPPATVIEYLLSTNRAVVIFDGLDELLDTTYRAEVSADVQSFASLYPSLPVLVTSREVGYDQAPLPSSTFPSYRLAQFTDEDVFEYARRWFAVGPDVTTNDSAAMADRFMADSSSVADLRSNALMLGLMCNLYKGSGYIPRNRPDVYEACADMLFDRWDRLRQIQVGLNIESHIKSSMQHLAYWIYQDPDLQSGATEDALVKEAADYLQGRRFDNREEAESEAGKFIEFCRGRAWVFTDTGTTPSGDRLYQFTHRTFLEFFAARHLARTHPSPEALLEVLKPHISAKEWDVVAQLSFQIMEKNVDGAADALLNALMPTHPDPTDTAQANRLDFAVRSLTFLVPSPLTARRLADSALELAMGWASHCANPEKSEWASVDHEINPVESVIDLLGANPENLNPIRSSLLQGLRMYLQDPGSGAYAAELGLNLGRRMGRLEHGGDIGQEIVQALVDAEQARLLQLAESESGIACDLVVLERMSVGEFLEHHELQFFFSHRLFWMFPQSGRVPLADLIFGGILWGANTGLSLRFLLDSLEDVGQVLERTPPPWTVVGSHIFAGSAWGFDFRRDTGADRLEDLTSLSPSERFALVAIAATVEEEAQALDKPRGGQDLGDLLARAPDGDTAPVWAVLAPIFRAKVSLSTPEEGRAALESLQLSRTNQQLLEGWLSGSVSLVEVVPLAESEPLGP